ncbi:MAG TPA: hypothetical protein VGO00_18975, partial [Kofleriaceae bacterium]|nr:hypothetical protein [Kofleriaceae bacterium]
RGIETNLPFHRRCLRHAAFVAGDFDTGFIGRNAKELAPRADEASLTAAVIAAAIDAVTKARPTATRPTANGAPAPTGEISGWRRQLL